MSSLPRSACFLALSLTLLTWSLRAGAREDLDRYQALEVRRRADPASVSGTDQRWLKRFELKYQKLFKRLPPVPEAVAAPVEAPAAGPSPAAVPTNVSPLPRSEEPKAAGQVVSPARRKEILALLDQVWDKPERRAEGIAPALELWLAEGKSAFLENYRVAFFMFLGFKQGTQGFPKNLALANAFRDYTKAAADHQIKSYQSTHVSRPGGPVMYSGKVPSKPAVPAGIPASPPPEVLEWGWGHGLTPPSAAAKGQMQAARERSRFYDLLASARKGNSIFWKDRDWAIAHELAARGLPKGSKAPQWEQAMLEGKPVRDREAARIAAENQAFQAGQKAKQEIESQLAGWYRLNPSQRQNLAEAIFRSGNPNSFGTYLNLIKPYEITPRVAQLIEATGQPILISRLRSMYTAPSVAATSGRSSGVDGYTPQTGWGSSYDDAMKAAKARDQYNRDSFMRGGNPNASWK